MRKRKEKLESTYVLPRPESVFVCEDPGRMDIWGQPMDDVHIEVRRKGKQTWYYCYGDIDGVKTCFGAELSMEGAYQVIKSLIPAECAVGKKAEHPVPENVSGESKAEVKFQVSSEELCDFVLTYNDWEDLRFLVTQRDHLDLDIPGLYHLLAISGHDAMLKEIVEFRETLKARDKTESQEQDDCCRGCKYLEVLDDDLACRAPADVWGTESVPCGLDKEAAYG